MTAPKTTPGRARAPVLAPGVRPREVLAWSMYDFANSGYTTVVITAVFNAYFVAVVAGNVPWATLAWTLTLAVSYAAVMVTAPVVGADADRHAAKKRLLVLTTLGCVACTAALAAAGPGELALACALVVASNFFFSTGENLIAAFLPELASSSVRQISIETAQSNLDCSVLADLPDKKIILGVINLGDMEVETPEVIAGRIRRALPFVSAERVIVAPDCGMKYLTREAAFGKLKSLAEGAALASRQLWGRS